MPFEKKKQILRKLVHDSILRILYQHSGGTIYDAASLQLAMDLM